MKRLILLCLSAAIWFGCDTDKALDNSSHSKPQEATEDVLTSELGPGFQSYENTDGFMRLGINKDLLGQELLFLANAVDHSDQPSWNGLRSRIVSFEKQDGRIHMFERTNPDMNLQENRRFLMTSFDIVRETNEAIFVSFHEGMDEMFYTSDWASAGDNQPQFDSSIDTWSWPTDDGFIANMERQGDYTVINHIFNVEYQYAWSMELVYALKKHTPDESYTPMLHPYTLDRMGFFATHPIFSPSDVHDRQYVSRWHADKKIVWAISANTPEEYRDAVYDGINYWNRALGRTGDDALIDIIDAPEDIVAPHYGYNMVQWVPNDSAGFAYADAQIDPRTGETLHANVFMASAFVASSKSTARRILRRIHETLESDEEQRTPGVKFAAWDGAKRCQMQYAQTHRDGYGQLLAAATTDEQVLTVSQDYLREVVAHEIGHTLGLRHNFAGSTAANYDFTQRTPLFEAYVDAGDYPADALGSSTVMDYSSFVEATMAGARMRRNLEPGLYDTLMTRKLYGDEEPSRDEIPLFCTDDHVYTGMDYNIWQDCKTWDVGPSPLVPSAVFGQARLRNVAYGLVEDFVWEKMAEDYLLDEFPMTPSRDASYVFIERADALAALAHNAAWIGVERNFPVVDETNAEDYEEAMKTFIEGELGTAGGLEEIFFAIDPNWKTDFLAEFNERIHRPSVRRGIAWGDNRYELTDGDIELAQERATRYADKYFEAITLGDVYSLMPDAPFADGIISDTMESIHATRQKDLLLEKNAEIPTLTLEIQVHSEDNPDLLIPTSVELPNFAYPDAARVAATDLLHASFSEKEDFGKSDLELHAVAWNTFIEAAYAELSFKPTDLDLGAQSDEVKTWFTTQIAISQAMAPYLPEPEAEAEPEQDEEPETEPSIEIEG